MKNIRLKPTDEKEIEDLTKSSTRAFDSDIYVGAKEAGGPPGYDCVAWHLEMKNKGHLYTAYAEDTMIGGAVVFQDERDSTIMYVGRIFVDPDYYGKSYGILIMEQLEEIYKNASVWRLDTPIWNQRTNRFYKKLGYQEVSRDQEFIYYEKKQAFG